METLRLLTTAVQGADTCTIASTLGQDRTNCPQGTSDGESATFDCLLSTATCRVSFQNVTRARAFVRARKTKAEGIMAHGREGRAGGLNAALEEAAAAGADSPVQVGARCVRP